MPKEEILTEGVLIALITATSLVVGGLLPKFVDLIYQWVSSEKTMKINIRQELMDETRELRREIREINMELDEWKVKYYELFNQYSVQRIENKRRELKYNDLLTKQLELQNEYESLFSKYNRILNRLEEFLPDVKVDTEE